MIFLTVKKKRNFFTVKKIMGTCLVSTLAFLRVPCPLSKSLPAVGKGGLICIDDRLQSFRHVLPQISLEGPIPRCTIHEFHDVLSMSILLRKG
jgi:hypothetical protein